MRRFRDAAWRRACAVVRRSALRHVPGQGRRWCVRGSWPARTRRSFPPFASSSALPRRSEEHTSELQSLMRISYAVFCLKKKKLSIELIVKKTTKENITVIKTIRTTYSTSSNTTAINETLIKHHY